MGIVQAISQFIVIRVTVRVLLCLLCLGKSPLLSPKEVITGQEKVYVEHFSSLSILSFHLIHWTLRVFPLKDYMDFILTVQP